MKEAAKEVFYTLFAEERTCFSYICWMLRGKYILLVLYVLAQNLASSQELKFEQFTTKNGLLSDEVYNVYQDKKGYIWAFTLYGPMKYTGKEFVPVLRNLPLKEAVIYAIHENRDGKIWIANSRKNIYEVRNDSAFIVKGTQQATERLRKATHEIRHFFVDDSLNVYLNTTLRAYKFLRKEDNSYLCIDLNARLIGKSNLDEDIYAHGKQLIWVPYIDPLSGNNLVKERKITILLDSVYQANRVFRISANSRIKFCKRFGEMLYLAFADRIVKLNKNGTTKQWKIGSTLLNFTKDSRGHFWIACYRDGLYEIDMNDSIIHHYFEGKTVHDVLADAHNGLWVTTDGSGLYHCSNLNEAYYSFDRTFGKSVNFLKEIHGKLFVGTTDANLHYIEHGNIKQVPKADERFLDDPLDVFHFDSLYLVPYRMHYECLVTDPTRGFVARKSPFDKYSFIPMAFSTESDGSLLFLSRNRIGKLPNASQALHKTSVKIQYAYMNKKGQCFHDYAGGMLVGTDQGVFFFDGDSLMEKSYLQPFKKFSITNIRKDSQNNIWFCTKGNGLFKMDERKKIINYTTISGLASDIINDISFVGDSGYLVSANNGLYYQKQLTPQVLTKPKKLLDGEIKMSILFEKKIYAATKQELVAIDEWSLAAPDVTFFNLNSIYVNGEPCSEAQIRDLTFRQNTLTFNFDVISFSKDAYALRYKLYNSVIDSGTVAENKIELSRLPPGTYTLAVDMLNGNSAHSVFIPFSIYPAFWQTAWFFFAMVFTGMVLVILIAWLLLRYYQTRALKKSEAEKLIAEYRLIALKAQINPHFMSNSIAAIQHLIIHNKVNEANEYLAKFSYLVRQVLNLSSKSLVPLKEEVEIIGLYLKLEQLRFERITVRVEVDESIDINSVYIPPMLAQPIIENAIWHGLLPLDPSKAPLLLILIKRQPGIIQILIEDNGVGRSANTLSIGNSRESKGIAITRQRIENLKYISGRDLAMLFYEDLTNSDGTAAGTRVIISLPDNLHL